MSRENLRNARKIGNLTPTLKSNLVVGDCWPVFLLVPDNVAGLMGMLKPDLSDYVCVNIVLLFAYLIFPKLCRYILEGKELEFYMKKLQRKKGKGAA